MARSTRRQKLAYHIVLAIGRRRLAPEAANRPDPLAELVAEFRRRRAAGDRVSMRRFCGDHHLSQKQFEKRLHSEAEAVDRSDTFLAYYARPEVQQALFAWAQGRRLAAHFHRPLGLDGFRRPEDVSLLAAAGNTHAPTFHASVGRYVDNQMVAFDLIAEVDYKGDWRRCFDVTRPLVQSLQSEGVPFLVKFSGNSSAHVIVPCRGTDYAGASVLFESRASRMLHSAKRMDLSFHKGTHYLRMPYALHERTGLVSLPLTPEEYDTFDPEMARPENVRIEPERLERILAADNRLWLRGRDPT
jgi:hypothetical protein